VYTIMPDSASQRQEVTRDEGLDRNPVPRDDSVDTIAAVHDVEEALPTSKPVDVAPDGGYGVSHFEFVSSLYKIYFRYCPPYYVADIWLM